MLVVRNLRRDVPAADGGVRTVFEEISFELAPGETLFITGRSGCGKVRASLRAVSGEQSLSFFRREERLLPLHNTFFRAHSSS